ncbi:MAG: hypothetical protein ACOY5F_01485 [Pseudomonadota bacterium]|jgi:hypothetical protein
MIVTRPELSLVRLLTAFALAASLMLQAGVLTSADAAPARKKVRVQKQAPGPQPYRWRPADPSFDRQGRLYKPPPGLPCPVDLGYGRWTSCLWDR